MNVFKIKEMKKIIITLALAVAATASAFAQVNLGAGYLNNSAKSTVSNTSSTLKTNGFYVGGDYNFNIAGGLGLDLGLQYQFLTGNDSSFIGKGTITEHYLAVPVMFNYGIALGNSAKLFAFAGPSAQLGLASNLKAEAVGLSTTRNLYGDNSDYGRFDILVGGGVGIELMDMVRFTVSYNYGLVDRNTSDNVTLHDSLLSAGVAFMF